MYGVQLLEIIFIFRTSSMQILLLSAHAYMYFVWKLQLDLNAYTMVYTFRSNCNKNACVCRGMGGLKHYIFATVCM